MSLSTRGAASAASLAIPWRFAPGSNPPYDADTNPEGVVSFGTAENHLMIGELHDFVQKKVDFPKKVYTYRYSTLGGEEFPVALAAYINNYFSPVKPVLPKQIITAAALTSIHELLGLSLADPGDGILVGRPVYGRFELDFGNTAGLKMVYADMHGVDAFSTDVVAKFQERLDAAKAEGVNIRALLIVNPNNPLGVAYPAGTLRAIMKFCESNELHLISDEVYALSTYRLDDGHDVPFTSVLAADTGDLISADRLHVLYGMSKDFAAAGLRLGSLITRNIELRHAVICNMRFHNPSGVSLAIATTLLEDREFVASFIEKSGARLRDSRLYTMSVLDAVGIKYQRGNAGFFMYIDLLPWLPTKTENNDNPDFILAQRLLDSGVGLHPCEEHAEKAGQFRLVFSQERRTLEEGLRRLTTVLKTIEQERV
ncbi:hypothetical protein Sste5346_007320 [Sporothrix stenoceras]|uniref:Aminotransferase class I/classII large domain-containing protein n=1 Tax=Sporothrix stenoceras TaxID=5173 RepID=A0ABR3YUH0_9PEZI